MHPFQSVFLAGLVGTWAFQTPQIFNPGAPGAAPRVVTAGEALALSRSTFTQDDVEFLRHMLVHHAQAVEMVELLRLHGEDPTVGRLGERIALSQEAEMALMREWLQARGQALTDPHGAHAMHGASASSEHDHQASEAEDTTPVMPGMLSPAQMRALAAARGTTFDTLFLQGMIHHHQGALDMVDALMDAPDAAEDPTLSEFANSVVADQSAEILRMQSLLSDL